MQRYDSSYFFLDEKVTKNQAAIQRCPRAKRAVLRADAAGQAQVRVRTASESLKSSLTASHERSVGFETGRCVSNYYK